MTRILADLSHCCEAAVNLVDWVFGTDGFRRRGSGSHRR
jgi:hypothetical protein